MVDMIELGWIFFFSLLGLMLAMRLKLPPVIGILLAGLLIGPNVLGLVTQLDVINAFADIGAILLLFIIGIEFSLSKIVQSGMRAMLLAFMKITFVFVVIYEVALLFGLTPFESLIVGAFFSFSSTTLFSKLIAGHELTNKNEINILFAVLIIEDVLAVFVLAVLSAANPSPAANLIFDDFAFSVVKSLAALIICYFILQKVVNVLFDYFTMFRTAETMIFASFSVCALFVFLATFFGFDASIGAFLAGSVIASVREFQKIEKTILPFGLFFSSFFFLSMGMLVDPGLLYSGIILIIALFVANAVAKFFSVGFGMYFLGSNIRSSIFSAISMLTVGEFSLLIAKKAQPFVSFDITGIASVLVFISALAAAIRMAKLPEVTLQTASLVPMNVRNSSKRISKHLNNVVMEFEPRGSFFRLFKSEMRSIVLYVLMLVMVNGLLLMFERILEVFGIVSFDIMPYSLIRLLVHVVVSIGFLAKIVRSFGSILNGVARAFKKFDKKHFESNKRMENNAVIILLLLGISAMLPFIFSLMQLPKFFDYFAMVPLVLCIIFIWDILATAHRAIKSRLRERYHYCHSGKRYFLF